MKILNSTGGSSTPEAARKRAVRTMFHMITWYESELKPGSKSWNSLKLVRKMHLNASRQSQMKGIGMISQTEVGLTAYGFMGVALTRPHVVGIRPACDADRDAFVFFWAVIFFMLGVRDEFNICLHPLPVAEIISEALRRYIFIQILQLETPMFDLMSHAFYGGAASFLPLVSYDVMMFLNKRAAGLPGYQYWIDMDCEKICKQLFTTEELEMIHRHYSAHEGYQFMKDFIIDSKLRILKVKHRLPKNNTVDVMLFEDQIDEKGTVDTDLIEEKNLIVLQKLLELESLNDLELIVIRNDDEWPKQLNDNEFYKLSRMDQVVVKICLRACYINYSWWGYRINEWVTNRILYQMERFHK